MVMCHIFQNFIKKQIKSIKYQGSASESESSEEYETSDKCFSPPSLLGTTVSDSSDGRDRLGSAMFCVASTLPCGGLDVTLISGACFDATLVLDPDRKEKKHKYLDVNKVVGEQ